MALSQQSGDVDEHLTQFFRPQVIHAATVVRYWSSKLLRFDEREQYFSNKLHFELLGARLNVPALAASLGWRVLRQLSVGAGIDIGMATRTQMQVYILSAADPSTLLIAPRIDTSIALAPHLGVTLHPWERWRLGDDACSEALGYERREPLALLGLHLLRWANRGASILRVATSCRAPPFTTQLR
jgi:hypothetical protein